MTANLLRYDENQTDVQRPWLDARHVTGHPPIPAAALPRLRRRALGHGWASSDEPIRWYARDAAASWAAVLDLHQAGEHDHASALARLLRWCDEQASAGVAVWQIDVPREAQLDLLGGEAT